MKDFEKKRDAWYKLMAEHLVLAVENYNIRPQKGYLAAQLQRHINKTGEDAPSSYFLTPDHKQLIVINFDLNFIRGFDDPGAIKTYLDSIEVMNNPCFQSMIKRNAKAGK